MTVLYNDRSMSGGRPPASGYKQRPLNTKPTGPANAHRGTGTSRQNPSMQQAGASLLSATRSTAARQGLPGGNQQTLSVASPHPSTSFTGSASPASLASLSGASLPATVPHNGLPPKQNHGAGKEARPTRTEAQSQAGKVSHQSKPAAAVNSTRDQGSGATQRHNQTATGSSLQNFLPREAIARHGSVVRQVKHPAPTHMQGQSSSARPVGMKTSDEYLRSYHKKCASEETQRTRALMIQQKMNDNSERKNQEAAARSQSMGARAGNSNMRQSSYTQAASAPTRPHANESNAPGSTGIFSRFFSRESSLY
ncbi:hypothetical protein P389DRAFT_207262 [Cystobasidium minutum MCA 4210]|uniref:uncharacterized protein n=1 Tax=Cystobasidium minutum MCA 4210 TaxID=1397322 RepID=UPI0034D00EED|eukprot:jgi/Rhomi1/207262/estExt_Genemark1.C_1_t10142